MVRWNDFSKTRRYSHKIANKNTYINKFDKLPKYLTLNFHGFGLSDKLVFDATDGIWVTNGHFDLIDKSDKKVSKDISDKHQ